MKMRLKAKSYDKWFLSYPQVPYFDSTLTANPNVGGVHLMNTKCTPSDLMKQLAFLEGGGGGVGKSR